MANINYLDELGNDLIDQEKDFIINFIDKKCRLFPYKTRNRRYKINHLHKYPCDYLVHHLDKHMKSMTWIGQTLSISIISKIKQL